MQQNYQDAMCIVAKFGKPDLFVTFTCNPKWPEIVNNLEKWQTSENRPDLVATVFHTKLMMLVDDITKGEIFGKVKAFLYVIEFQKRGLPHSHMLIILEALNKIRGIDAIDSLISAEIPDKLKNKKLFDVVINCMMHGPCGVLNQSAICMENGSCTKQFPKDFQNTTIENANDLVFFRPD